MKKLTLAIAALFLFTGVSFAAVDSQRTLDAVNIQPDSCLIEIDRGEGDGWEIITVIDPMIDLTVGYPFTVSVAPNKEYRTRSTVAMVGEAPITCISGPFIEIVELQGACVH